MVAKVFRLTSTLFNLVWLVCFLLRIYLLLLQYIQQYYENVTEK